MTTDMQSHGHCSSKEDEMAIWIVKAYTGRGWQEIKRFDNPGDAENWLFKYVKDNGYIFTDFNIIRKEQ